jgi:hypothetical protein
MPTKRHAELAAIRENLITTRALTLTNRCILADIVHLLTQHADDPEAVLQHLSESVMARVDRETEGKVGPVPFFTRLMAKQFFEDAGEISDVQGAQDGV